MIAYPLDQSILFKGMVFHLNLDYDNILRLHEMQRDIFLADDEKIILTLQMLILKRSRWRLLFFKWPQRIKLLQTILENFINIKVRPSKDPRKAMDFTQDAPYIYASFWQAYGIDLHRQKLDWREFMALLQSLPEKTKIREIVRIRTEPLPKPTQHNGEQIKRMMEAKAYWALEVSEAEAQKQFQQGVRQLAEVLKKNTAETHATEGGTNG